MNARDDDDYLSLKTQNEYLHEMLERTRLRLSELEKQTARRLIAFGSDDVVVTTGEMLEKPAVFVRPGSKGDPDGEATETVEALVPGEVVLVFPAPEHADLVADTLVMGERAKARWQAEVLGEFTHGSYVMSTDLYLAMRQRVNELTRMAEGVTA